MKCSSNHVPQQLDSPASTRCGSPAAVEDKEEVFDPANPRLIPGNSVLLSITDIPQYLDKALLALGLHTEARTSFITSVLHSLRPTSFVDIYLRYWLPQFLEHKHIAFRFLPQSAYELAAQLHVSPNPSSVTRIFMLWKGIAPQEKEDWQNASDRALKMEVDEWKQVVGVLSAAKDGLRVLEWGGLEVKY
jgi:hypothetical protein